MLLNPQVPLTFLGIFAAHNIAWRHSKLSAFARVVGQRCEQAQALPIMLSKTRMGCVDGGRLREESSRCGQISQDHIAARQSDLGVSESRARIRVVHPRG